MMDLEAHSKENLEVLAVQECSKMDLEAQVDPTTKWAQGAGIVMKITSAGDFKQKKTKWVDQESQ